MAAADWRRPFFGGRHIATIARGQRRMFGGGRRAAAGRRPQPLPAAAVAAPRVLPAARRPPISARRPAVAAAHAAAAAPGGAVNTHSVGPGRFADGGCALAERRLGCRKTAWTPCYVLFVYIYVLTHMYVQMYTSLVCVHVHVHGLVCKTLSVYMLVRAHLCMYVSSLMVHGRVPLRKSENIVEVLTGVCEKNAHLKGVELENPRTPWIQCCLAVRPSGAQTSAKKTLIF